MNKTVAQLISHQPAPCRIINFRKRGLSIFLRISFDCRLQREDIKLGRKNSGCFFIWVVKEHDDLQFIDGLEEKTRDKGLIIRGWAPQAVILSHPSIGAFLTHCGWSSLPLRPSFWGVDAHLATVCTETLE
ncbi:hypothetical protein EJ110_NYTH22381 [Nymphaea thermarum]|nr:hypothetical protein EJ110_NYTH22381 [Nymphaea thermarum]